MRSRRVGLLIAASVAVGAGGLVAWLTAAGHDDESPIGGVCRSLSAGHQFASVPGDVMEQAEEVSQIRLDDLAEPSLEQVEAARAELLRTASPRSTRWIDRYTACLVDYSRTGRVGDPDADPPLAPVVQRDHVPALLLYEDREHPVVMCFGPGDSCGQEPTYLIHCAMFVDAETGDLLRVGACWGFRDDG